MRVFFNEEDRHPWIARVKLLRLLKKLNMDSIEYVFCRKSLGGSKWLFELKMLE